MSPLQTDFNLVYPADFLPVMLDGILLGYVDPQQAGTFVQSLRSIKVLQEKSKHKLYSVVPVTLEIAFLAPGRHSKPS